MFMIKIPPVAEYYLICEAKAFLYFELKDDCIYFNWMSCSFEELDIFGLSTPSYTIDCKKYIKWVIVKAHGIHTDGVLYMRW